MQKGGCAPKTLAKKKKEIIPFRGVNERGDSTAD